MILRPKFIRESLFGSFAAVKKIQACFHEWTPDPGWLFNNGLHVVWARCTRCGTRWAPPRTRSA